MIVQDVAWMIEIAGFLFKNFPPGVTMKHHQIVRQFRPGSGNSLSVIQRLGSKFIQPGTNTAAEDFVFRIHCTPPNFLD